MRTTVEIDDELMRAALQFAPTKIKREAVELGLRTLVRLGQQTEARKMRGNLVWEGDLDAMRDDGKD